jgi:hypothetical protein
MNKVSGLKLLRRRQIVRCVAAVLLLAGSSLSLSGCVVAPASPGYYGRPYGYGQPHYYRPRPYRPYW